MNLIIKFAVNILKEPVIKLPMIIARLVLFFNLHHVIGSLFDAGVDAGTCGYLLCRDLNTVSVDFLKLTDNLFSAAHAKLVGAGS